MAAYLTTPEEAGERLASFGYETAKLRAGHLRLASSKLDELGPFVGEREESDQDGEWPRTATGITQHGVIPDLILDAVAILAYEDAEGMDTTPVKSQSDLDSSITYEEAGMLPTTKQALACVRPYQRKNGRIL